MNRGGRPKGLPKTGGRKKGTPNKVGPPTKELITKFVLDHWDDFIVAYNSIEKPQDKCNIMLGLMPYTLPKMASIEYKDKDKPLTLEDELSELSGETSR